jgi:hypothetical protein
MERSNLIRNSLFAVVAVVGIAVTSVFTIQQNRSQSRAQAATQATISQVLQQNGISSDTVQSCPEGISEPLMKMCGEPQCDEVPPLDSVNTAGGGASSVTKPVCTVSIEFSGVRCMDGSIVDYKPFGEGCIQATKEEFSARFSEIGDEMRSLCAGKKAPSCSSGGSASSGAGGTDQPASGGVPASAGSGSGGSTLPPVRAGDVNGDGIVDLLDYSVWLNAFTSNTAR